MYISRLKVASSLPQFSGEHFYTQRTAEKSLSIVSTITHTQPVTCVNMIKKQLNKMRRSV